MKRLMAPTITQAEHIRAIERRAIRKESLAQRPEFGPLKPALEKMEATAKALMGKGEKEDMALLPTTLTHQDIEGIIQAGREAAIELILMENNGEGGAYRELLPENPELLRTTLMEMPVDELFLRIRKTLDNEHPLVRTETALLLAAIALDDEVFDLEPRKRAFELLAVKSPHNTCSEALIQCFGHQPEDIHHPFDKPLGTISTLACIVGGISQGALIGLFLQAGQFAMGALALGGLILGMVVPILAKEAKDRKSWRARVSEWIGLAPKNIELLKLQKRAEAEKQLPAHEPEPEGETYLAGEKQHPLKV